MSRRAVWLLATPALFATPLHAQVPGIGPDSLTPEFTLTLRHPSELRFSPDGHHLAFVVTEPPESSGTSRHIWILDVPTRTVRRFTASAKSEWSPRWSPDGRRLAFLSDRQDRTHLYVMPIDGGEARAVTSGQLSPSAFDWSPDGTRIAFLAGDTGTTPDPRVVDRDDPHTRVWLLDIASGAVRPVTAPNWQVAELAWTPGGTSLVVAATDRPASDSATARILALDLADDSLRAIAAPRGYFTELQVSPDGSTVGYISCRVDGPWPHDLTMASLTDGSVRNITSTTLDRMILQYAWEPGGSLMALAAAGFGTHLVRLLAPDARAVSLPINGNLDAFAVSRSGVVAFVREGAVEPPELYLWDARTPAVRVSHLNDAWLRVGLVTPGRFTHRSFDGMEIEGELLQPAQRAGASPPALITLVHGGPTGRWSDAVDPLGQLLAQRGFAVFYPNVRGSLGYGERFMELNRGDWGGGDFRDVMAGIDTLIARGLVDSARLGIGGWSYGGYLSAWAITQTRRFKAAIVGAGIADLISEIGTEGASWYDEWFNGWPAEHPERYLRSSPFRYLANARTPTLILHGEDDRTDPIGQGQELYRGLKHYGVTAEFVVYPRESHHLSEQKHLLDRLTRILAWYEQYLVLRSEVR